jgi:hypothetical protein
MRKGILKHIPIKFRGTLECFENLHFNKLDKLLEMDKFLDAHDPPKVNQDDISHICQQAKACTGQIHCRLLPDLQRRNNNHASQIVP